MKSAPQKRKDIHINHICDGGQLLTYCCYPQAGPAFTYQFINGPKMGSIRKVKTESDLMENKCFFTKPYLPTSFHPLFHFTIYFHEQKKKKKRKIHSTLFPTLLKRLLINLFKILPFFVCTFISPLHLCLTSATCPCLTQNNLISQGLINLTQTKCNYQFYKLLFR